MQVNITEARLKFEELVNAAERGERVIIARRGKPVVRLTVDDLPTDLSNLERFDSSRKREPKPSSAPKTKGD